MARYKRNNIVIPTAEQQYLLYKEHGLTQFDNYDEYALYLYKNCSDSWHGVAGITGSNTDAPERKNNTVVKNISRTSTKDYSISPEERIESERLEFEAKLEKVVSENKFKKRFIPESISVEKLKSKKKRNMKNYRKIENTCPYCISKLAVNKGGLLYCTGDKFRVWEQAFSEYDKAKPNAKLKIIEKYSRNLTLFLDLHDRWSYANAEKEPFNCGYTNTLFNPVSSFDCTIPDPIVVGNIERHLGRHLTEEERMGEDKIYYKQGAYFTEWQPKSKEIKIPILRFPYSFLSREQ